MRNSLANSFRPTSRFAPLLIATLGLPAAAQNIWDKPSKEWTETDAKRILSESPWAGKADAVCGSRRVKSGVYVRLEGSTPVREALLKVGVLPASPKEVRQISIAILIPTSGNRECAITDLDGAKKSATIRLPEGRPPEQSTSVRLLKQDDKQDLLIFSFIRPDPLPVPQVFRLPGVTLHSSQLSFSAIIAKFTVTKSFSLNGMYYLGQLEL